MRILLIDFAYQNINRTVMLWPLAWREVGEVTRFGPGHVSDEDWKAGLRPFLKKHGRFDVIVAAELLVSALTYEKDLDHVIRSLDNTYECPFDLSGAMEGCQRVFDEFVVSDAIRVISMLEFDSYNMHPSHKDRIQKHDFFVIGWGKEFVQPRSAISDLHRESFGARVNDHWWDFINANAHRVISSAAMISESEFCWSRLDYRRQRWAVQGARYAARQEVRVRLRKAGIPWTGLMLVDMISIINRINSKALRWPFVRNFFNHCWDQGFRTSRYAFTCGSALGFPIRKYFEIPASGTVLAAQPPNGFMKLGFRDRVNAVVTTPETIVEIDAWLQANPADAQLIASAGQELVWARHTVRARGEQYARAIEAIAGRRFAGSGWEDGEFKIIEKPIETEVQ
ncbi:MAG: hypothetical protein NPIRA05_08820 [Nitrospirales bacterium]|nr:MAG: hypothetical protein NPIRA05_08820 [Nitrospirales bacterium]